jgi:type III pantothenate kinase
VFRVVADLGNSRLKWGLLGPDAALAASLALPLDEPAAWERAYRDWELTDRASDWAIASVNPPLAERLVSWLARQRPQPRVRLFRSAAEVPVRHILSQPDSTGADRALAVWQVVQTRRDSQPVQVVSCGTALTVEWISAEGVWQGGAIAPGLPLLARALHEGTAQLPLAGAEQPPPAALGTATVPAMQAGLFWGAVGIARELIARQRVAGGSSPREIWTGGDAARLAPWVSDGDAVIRPDLVLEGLAALAFGRQPA